MPYICIQPHVHQLSRNVRNRTFGYVRPAKIQSSLRIRAVWSESLLGAFWIASEANCLHADTEDSDLTARVLLSFRHNSERRFLFFFFFFFLLCFLFLIKILCSDWPYLIRNHLSFCVLFSTIYHRKSKFMAKNVLTYVKFYSKLTFSPRNHFLFSFTEFELLVFHNNIENISEKLNKQNVL